MNNTPIKIYVKLYWSISIAVVIASIFLFSEFVLFLVGLSICIGAVIGILTKTSCFPTRASYSNLYDVSKFIGRIVDITAFIVGLILIIRFIVK